LGTGKADKPREQGLQTMDFGDYRPLPAVSADAFNVTLTLTVENAASLWAAAADRALQGGMNAADMLDTLGPREDPSIADCIAMLTAPAALPGCTLDGFRVDETAPSASAQVIALPTASATRTALRIAAGA
jgi:hypothetical protein